MLSNPEPHLRPWAHWLNIAALLTDIAFETDIAGRFTAFGGTDVLGYAASDLLRQNLGDLVALSADFDSGAASIGAIFASLHSRKIAWRGMVGLQRADGSQGVYQLFLAPKLAAPKLAAPKLAAPRRGVPRLGFPRLAAQAAPDPVAETAAEWADGAYGLLINLDAPTLRVLAPGAHFGRVMLDPQTGLWSAASFADAVGRRFDRLDVEGLPGTLLLLGFSRTPPVGRGAVATQLAEELRDIIRPTDLLGRLDATTFALWCDGMDDLTGAERAARFCQRLPAGLPGPPCISVGLAARWPGKAEDAATLIRRAGAALRHAERVAQAATDAGSTESVASGTWRAWNPSLPT
jgi:GGDEF domain-containing protein